MITSFQLLKKHFVHLIYTKNNTSNTTLNSSFFRLRLNFKLSKLFFDLPSSGISPCVRTDWAVMLPRTLAAALLCSSRVGSDIITIVHCDGVTARCVDTPSQYCKQSLTTWRPAVWIATSHFWLWTIHTVFLGCFTKH